MFMILKNLNKHYNDPLMYKENWAEEDGSVKLIFRSVSFILSLHSINNSLSLPRPTGVAILK